MKLLFREYGSFIMSFIVSILFFFILFGASWTAANYGSGKGIKDALKIESDKGTDVETEYIDKVDKSKDIAIHIHQQELNTNSTYYWTDLIRPAKEYISVSDDTQKLLYYNDDFYTFALIDIRYLSDGTRYYLGDDSDRVKIEETDKGIAVTFKQDGLYQMRFRLIDNRDGSEEMGVASLYISKEKESR